MNDRTENVTQLLIMIFKVIKKLVNFIRETVVIQQVTHCFYLAVQKVFLCFLSKYVFCVFVCLSSLWRLHCST